MEDSKLLWTSKTFWVNLLAMIAMVVQTQTGFVIEPEAQAGLWAVINVIIRLVTKQPATLK